MSGPKRTFGSLQIRSTGFLKAVIRAERSIFGNVLYVYLYCTPFQTKPSKILPQPIRIVLGLAFTARHGKQGAPGSA